jgi:hypothetical protein
MKTTINSGRFDYSANAMTLISKNMGEDFPPIIDIEKFPRETFKAAKSIMTDKII